MFPIAFTSSVVDIHKSKAPLLYAAAVTTYVLAVVAVALRFRARMFTARMLTKKASRGDPIKSTEKGIWVDDWTVTVALVRFRNKVQ